MSREITLKEAERKAFTSTFEDGLWDIFIGCFVLMFAVAPFLSRRLGDFWSSAVFVPFWALVYVAIRVVRKYVVTPRIGVVRFGLARKAKLLKFNAVVFVVLLVGLILGIVSAVKYDVPGWIHTARFGLIILVAFSVAAYLLDFTRLYLYGVLIALSPLVGEWLYVQVKAPHHGYPITFGATAGIIILAGLVEFVRLLRHHPIPTEEPSSEEA